MDPRKTSNIYLGVFFITGSYIECINIKINKYESFFDNFLDKLMKAYESSKPVLLDIAYLSLSLKVLFF